MKKILLPFKEDAVSPVVAVMLMLVVTIIIAAVVSAFAGGLADEQDKVPQVQIRASYSQTTGMEIEHLGGDPIGTQSTTVMVRPSNTFGNAEHVISIVNKTLIVSDFDVDAGTASAWVRNDGYSGEKTFRPGETHYIKAPYHTHEYLQPGVSSTYQFDNQGKDQAGRTFWLEFADKSGKVFTKTEVIIEP